MKFAKKFRFIFFILPFFAIFPKISESQSFIDFKDARQNLGMAQIKDTKVGLFIDFKRDSAVLAASITKGNANPKYIPLSSSTSRGFPKMTLQLFVSKAGDELWIKDLDIDESLDNGIFAYHRLGSDLATSQWGTRPLFDSPNVVSSTGGKFPKFDPSNVQPLATFYFTGEESPLPKATRKNGW